MKFKRTHRKTGIISFSCKEPYGYATGITEAIQGKIKVKILFFWITIKTYWININI